MSISKLIRFKKSTGKTIRLTQEGIQIAALKTTTVPGLKSNRKSLTDRNA